MGSHCRLLWEWEMLNKLCVHCFLFEFMHFSTSIKLNWITVALNASDCAGYDEIVHTIFGKCCIFSTHLLYHLFSLAVF